MRFRRLIYIIVPLILFLIVFVLDILGKSIALDLFGIRYLRDLFVLVAFFFSYLFLRSFPSFSSLRS